MTTEYILFVGELANFCPRTALIPAKEFINARKEDYEAMKDSAVEHNGFSQVLFKNFIWSGNMGTLEPTKWGGIVSTIMHYIDEDYDRNLFGSKEDRGWIDGMITDLSASDFNANKIMKKLDNTQFYVDGNPIVISESFLVMEKDDGKLKNEPLFDTVGEFLADYHNIPPALLPVKMEDPKIVHLKSPIWPDPSIVLIEREKEQNKWKPILEKWRQDKLATKANSTF